MHVPDSRQRARPLREKRGYGGEGLAGETMSTLPAADSRYESIYIVTVQILCSKIPGMAPHRSTSISNTETKPPGLCIMSSITSATYRTQTALNCRSVGAQVHYIYTQQHLVLCNIIQLQQMGYCTATYTCSSISVVDLKKIFIPTVDQEVRLHLLL